MTKKPDKAAPVTDYQIRTFAFPLGGLFALIGTWPWIWYGTGIRIWALLISGALIIPGILFPRILTPAYRGWMVFADKLAWFNTRVLLGFIFYGVLTPIGLIRKVFGKPSFTCGFDKHVSSYRVLKSSRPSNHMAKSF